MIYFVLIIGILIKFDKFVERVIMRTDKINADAGLKIANPFKTSRTNMTNPFKYQDFEGNDISFKGNTLQYADVFEGYKPSFKGVNKLKMVASSVAGSVTRTYSSMTESIVNFAKRISGWSVSAWNYAKNTNISDLPGIKHVKESIHNIDIKKGIKDTVDSVKSKISIPEWHLGFTDGLRDTWNTMVQKLNHKSITSDVPVAELRELWVNIIEEGKKVA